MDTNHSNHKTEADRRGFYKTFRGEPTRELMHNKNAFMLLSLIALRARRTQSFSTDNLEPGQALIGDHRACGLTQSEYRTAKKSLARYHLATFKTTSKGTIATLCNTDVFDINIEKVDNQNRKPIASQSQADDKLMTTNKKERRKKNEKKERTPATLRLPKGCTTRAQNRTDLSIGGAVTALVPGVVAEKTPTTRQEPTTDEVEHWLAILKDNSPRTAIGKVCGKNNPKSKIFQEAFDKLAPEIVLAECAYVEGYRERNSINDRGELGGILTNRLKKHLNKNVEH